MPPSRSIDVAPLVSLCEEGIRDGAFPGAAFAVGTPDSLGLGVAGRQRFDAESPAVDPGTIWDLASLSKVVGTTSAALFLHEEGNLDLDASVVSFLPEFQGEGKNRVTVRDLLLHRSGLPAYRNYVNTHSSQEAVRRSIVRERLVYPTGERTVYSCLGFVVLQRVIESVAGCGIDRFLADRLFGPLGMSRAGYCPERAVWPRCAPTEPPEPWRAKFRSVPIPESMPYPFVQGEVHDPVAFCQGGVSGNAGLFASIEDMAAFGLMLVRGGQGPSRQIFCSAKLSEWTRRATNSSSRALGWDTRSDDSSCGPRFGPRSYGHTGFTGTSIWVDPERSLFAVLLTNRVHPTAANLKITPFRKRFHDAVVDVVPGG
ncbi:MAG: serine hydrolase domain-containing protein [Fimbriimonadaceae bacterium]